MNPIQGSNKEKVASIWPDLQVLQFQIAGFQSIWCENNGIQWPIVVQMCQTCGERTLLVRRKTFARRPRRSKNSLGQFEIKEG